MKDNNQNPGHVTSHRVGARVRARLRGSKRRSNTTSSLHDLNWYWKAKSQGDLRLKMAGSEGRIGIQTYKVSRVGSNKVQKLSCLPGRPDSSLHQRDVDSLCSNSHSFQQIPPLLHRRRLPSPCDHFSLCSYRRYLRRSWLHQALVSNHCYGCCRNRGCRFPSFRNCHCR